MLNNVEKYVEKSQTPFSEKEKYPLSRFVMKVVSSLSKAFDSYQYPDFEYKLGDAFIRIFELCAYLEFIPEHVGSKWARGPEDNVPGDLGVIIRMILGLRRDDFKNPIESCINQLLRVCKYLSIPIEEILDEKLS